MWFTLGLRLDSRDYGRLQLMEDPFAEALSDQIASSPQTSIVLRAIHGTSNPVTIAAQLSESAEVMAGLRPTDLLFHSVSGGSVTGLRLEDGSNVVIKAYQPRWQASFLAAVLETQRRLHGAEIPCPRPLGGPARCGLGLATMESFLSDPGHQVRADAVARKSSVEGLANLIDNAGHDRRLLDNPMLIRHGSLYPIPHSPIFDFTASATGANWIDDLASLALSEMSYANPISAHTDWSARNVRLGHDGVLAIYDMDSLATVSLATALGQAAATWRASGEAEDTDAPDLDELNDYLDLYPGHIDSNDRRSALAAALWVLAYTARCEHSIDPDETKLYRARRRLRADATSYVTAITRR